jgi:hypothetical protein
MDQQPEDLQPTFLAQSAELSYAHVHYAISSSIEM